MQEKEAIYPKCQFASEAMAAAEEVGNSNTETIRSDSIIRMINERQTKWNKSV